MSIYHTDGGVRVRGYLDAGNYSDNYSDPEKLQTCLQYEPGTSSYACSCNFLYFKFLKVKKDIDEIV